MWTAAARLRRCPLSAALGTRQRTNRFGFRGLVAEYRHKPEPNQVPRPGIEQEFQLGRAGDLISCGRSTSSPVDPPFETLASERLELNPESRFPEAWKHRVQARQDEDAPRRYWADRWSGTGGGSSNHIRNGWNPIKGRRTAWRPMRQAYRGTFAWSLFLPARVGRRGAAS